MMKKLLFILVAYLVSTNISAQNLLSESFEGTFPPTGWTKLNASATGGRDWVASDDASLIDGPYSAKTGSKCMIYEYTSSSAADAWMITPAISLVAGTNYQITFWYRVRSASYPEKLKITFGTSATVAAQTTTLWNNNGGASLTNTTYAQATINYTAVSTGSGYFGFNCYSLADEWAIQVDDISIDALNPCSGTPTAGSATTTTPYLCTAGTSVLNLSGSSTSTGLSYQWQSSPTGANTWSNIGGATTVPYTATVSASTDYRCIVTCTNGGASANSTPITVTLGSIPSNDDPCNAITLVLDAASQCANTTCATATGDPSFANSTPNNTVWYKYTPSSTGVVNFIMTRPAGVSSGLLYGWLGVYTATGTCPTLSFTEVTSSLAYDLTSQTSVTLVSPTLTAGTTYYFMVDGFSGAYGAYCIQMITPPTPPTCTTNLLPANAATNVDYLSGVKIKWTPVATATSYDVYWGTTNPPTSSIGTLTADSVTITGLSANTTYYWYILPKNNGGSAVGCSANTTSFTTSNPPPAPANDDCASAVTIGGYSAPTAGTIVSATQTSAPESCSGGTSSAALDVWYKFTALTNGDATITVVCGTGFDAVVGAYSGTCGSFTTLACADNTSSAGTETLALTGLTAGTTYYARVYGWNTSTGTFTIAISGTAMPVNYASLSGERKGNTNVISWVTATETNNAGFELQRSADGINFNQIAFIESKATFGNSSSQLSYSYTDIKPLISSGYYRLKQIDKDGRYHLSNVISIKGIKPSKLELSSIYPNPVSSNLSVSLVSPKNDNITFVICDMTGKSILKYNKVVTSGDNLFSFDLSSLATGSYTIKAICADGCETAINKFVKL